MSTGGKRLPRFLLCFQFYSGAPNWVKSSTENPDSSLDYFIVDSVTQLQLTYSDQSLFLVVREKANDRATNKGKLLSKSFAAIFLKKIDLTNRLYPLTLILFQEIIF